MRRIVRFLSGVAMSFTALFVGFRYGVPMYGMMDSRSSVETAVTAPCKSVTVLDSTLYTGCTGSAAGGRHEGYVHGATHADVVDGSVQAMWVAGGGYTELSEREAWLALATPLLTVLALRLLNPVRRRSRGGSDSDSSSGGGDWDGDSGDSGGGD